MIYKHLEKKVVVEISIGLVKKSYQINIISFSYIQEM